MIEVHKSDQLKHLLLDMISTSRSVTREMLADLSAADWEVVCGIAKQQRLGPLLHYHRQTIGRDWRLPPEVQAEWADAFRQAAFRALSIHMTLVTLNGILDGAGIQYAALKGAWLSRYAYDHPALRPMRDIDILVERGKAQTAYMLFEERGFARPDYYIMPPEHALEDAKHLPPLRCLKTGISVEVHTRLVHDQPIPAVSGTFGDIGALLVRATRKDGIAYLSHTDTLLHLIVHAAYDHQFNNGPLIFNDVALLLARVEVDWPLFWKMAEAGGWLRGCQLVFELTSQYHPIVGWQPSNGRLQRPSPIQLESAALLSLQDFDQRGLVGFQAELAVGTGLVGKARILLKRAFPARHTLAAFSGTSSTTWWALLHYPRWLFARAKPMLFADQSSGVREDIDRATHVRNWVYGGPP